MTTTMKARPTLYKGIQMRSRLEADREQAVTLRDALNEFIDGGTTT